LGALLIDGECVVDSWLPCIAFLHQAINNGAKVSIQTTTNCHDPYSVDDLIVFVC
jgi:hypothetical protein